MAGWYGYRRNGIPQFDSSVFTVALAGARRSTVEFTPPALAAGVTTPVTYTVANASTAAIYVFTPRLPFSTAYIVHGVRCSTAGEVTMLWTNQTASSIGTGESTNRGLLIEFTQ